MRQRGALRPNRTLTARIAALSHPDDVPFTEWIDVPNPEDVADPSLHEVLMKRPTIADAPQVEYWVAYGDYYEGVSFKRDRQGIVHIRGSAFATDISEATLIGPSWPLFVLPPDYRPNVDIDSFSCSVLSSGEVRPPLSGNFHFPHWGQYQLNLWIAFNRTHDADAPDEIG